MPDVEEITRMLAGSYITYYHCKRIVELLKVSEADSKSFFGTCVHPHPVPTTFVRACATDALHHVCKCTRSTTRVHLGVFCLRIGAVHTTHSVLRVRMHSVHTTHYFSHWRIWVCGVR